MGQNEKIIVSLTSWSKRINNVYTVLQNIINGTVKPDNIELNLSIKEFPNKENDLPQKLLTIDILNINWVEHNTRTFKKIIPTLQKYYGKKYYLLSIDDDWIYSLNYVELMLNYIKQYNTDSFCLSNSKVIGNRQIYKSSCFKNDFWECLTQEVIVTGVDDEYIEYYLNTHNKIIANYRPNNVLEITKQFNEVYPLHDEYNNPNYINEAYKKIHKIKFNE